MTFCLGIKVRDGLVGIADTRVMTGSECLTARKLNVYPHNDSCFYVMTSGLRSVRDKVLTYFEEHLTNVDPPHDRLFKVVNALADYIRRVAQEDKTFLRESGLEFNIFALVGGQLPGDKEHKLYMIYPQGNWVEIGHGSPYQIIGQHGYGKPVLDRTLTYEDSMQHAFKVGFLAFDSTRISAADVNFPIDVALFPANGHSMVEHRYERGELAQISAWWQERLRQSVSELPGEWIRVAFDKLKSQSSCPPAKVQL